MQEGRRSNDPLISIGALAEKVGLSVSSVRKYEAEGLIIPHRSDSGQRLFSMEDIDRIFNIQHLIQDVGLNMEGIRRLHALLPCWEIMSCDKSMREDCPAFASIKKPCWTIRGLPCAPKGNECRQCAVYRYGSQCTENMKSLLYYEYFDRQAGLAARKLAQLIRNTE